MGSFVVSLDAELAWGYHRYSDDPSERIGSGRDGWFHLIDLFDQYQIPATWAVVGHLFHTACGGHHPDHPVPEGWFENDPGGTESRNGDWFGNEVIEAVRTADVDHEIGCHSYSHVVFGAPETRSETAAAELRACKQLAKQQDIKLNSFTFPRNEVGHLDILADHDFVAYRSPNPPGWFEQTPLSKPAKLVNMLTRFRRAPLMTPTIKREGLVAIPASLHLFTFEGAVRRVASPVASQPVVDIAKKTIDAATRKDGVFHLWFHPHAVSTQANVDRVRSILSYARERSDSIDFRTMGEIARERLTAESGEQ
ncbi:polysaccharide deacetylase family protein [Halorientalis marina]|uniref:polysaccharide deacetylase family protein n=1 Tax=Halorientalis marina TaxID=2931976 RepID=UPI001FF50AE9|nr:polysaccharide deacetylase family protein [Halorientalis marina]